MIAPEFCSVISVGNVLYQPERIVWGILFGILSGIPPEREYYIIKECRFLPTVLQAILDFFLASFRNV